MSIILNTSSGIRIVPPIGWIEPSSPIQIKEASLLRKTRAILHKIFHDCWVSLWNRFRAVSIKPTLKLQIAQFKERTHFDYSPYAVDDLRIDKTLQTSSMRAYCKKLAAQFPQSHFIESYLTRGAKIVELPEVSRNSRQLMIPIHVKGLLRDHIIAVFFDRINNTLEFYDPKGLTIMDHARDRPINDPSINIPEVIRRLIAKYGNSRTKVVENTAKHQYDSHNCGVHVCDYFTRRIAENEAPDHIEQQPSIDPSQIRIEMIQRLIS